MEDKLVSKHILDASQYEGKGKWKGVIQGWVVFLIIYGITRIPNVQQAMLDFANSMKGVAWLSSGVKRNSPSWSYKSMRMESAL